MAEVASLIKGTSMKLKPFLTVLLVFAAIGGIILLAYLSLPPGKSPNPDRLFIKTLSKEELAEFNQGAVAPVKAEARPVAEVEVENAKLRSENAELRDRIQDLLHRLSNAEGFHPLSKQMDKYIKEQDAKIDSLWSAIHKLGSHIAGSGY